MKFEGKLAHFHRRYRHYRRRKRPNRCSSHKSTNSNEALLPDILTETSPPNSATFLKTTSRIIRYTLSAATEEAVPLISFKDHNVNVWVRGFDEYIRLSISSTDTTHDVKQKIAKEAKLEKIKNMKLTYDGFTLEDEVKVVYNYNLTPEPILDASFD